MLTTYAGRVFLMGTGPPLVSFESSPLDQIAKRLSCRGITFSAHEASNELGNFIRLKALNTFGEERRPAGCESLKSVSSQF